MQTRINAEFESVEGAERAVQAIRKSIESLSDIRIKTRAVNRKAKKMYICAMRSENITAPFFIPAFPEGEGEYTTDTENIEPLNSAVLEIVCDEALEKEVHGIILNHGGLKVRNKGI
ncbi:MAG: hypothetical protein E7507_04150 [Ruminococcus sp.]|nr:hypothetical protein [Ruminococcus sp.]